MARSRRRTPAEIVGTIISAAMGATGVSQDRLAETAHVHVNTVRSDLKDPDKMTMHRMWLYFVALNVPIDDGLKAFADSFSRSLITDNLGGR